MDAQLSGPPLTGLLNLYSAIVQEFVRRKVCTSTNNFIADVAKLLVIKALGLTPARKSNKGVAPLPSLQLVSNGVKFRYWVTLKRIADGLRHATTKRQFASM